MVSSAILYFDPNYYDLVMKIHMYDSNIALFSKKQFANDKNMDYGQYCTWKILWITKMELINYQCAIFLSTKHLPSETKE